MVNEAVKERRHGGRGYRSWLHPGWVAYAGEELAELLHTERVALDGLCLVQQAAVLDNIQAGRPRRKLPFKIVGHVVNRLRVQADMA